MKQKSTFENFIKEELHNGKHPFNEALWNKLDLQLIPVREAYAKKEKRRVVFYWSLLGVLLLGGTGVILNNKATNKEVANASEKTTKNVEAVVKNAIENNQENVKPTVNVPTIVSSNDILINNNNVTVVNTTDKQSSLSAFNKEDNSIPTFNKTRNRNKKSATKKQKDDFVENEIVANNTESGVEKIMEQKEMEKVEEAINKIEEDKVTTKLPEVNNIAKEDKPIKATDNKAKEIKANETLPLEWYATGGANFSSPFNKGGYYGGLFIERQIKDKRIFAGVKVAYNNLDHQLVASKNASVFPQTTDAMINKMTTIQIPFGYQFKLSKGAVNKAVLLNVGFEPTFITGIQTIYYDDNGVPGGPRVPVVNSPLLSNAINKFNVSFIAGIKKPITNRLGFTLNAGYGLIDITDKQYYNKTNSTNNLKYFQAGLSFRLK
jgi:hypothetical protein